MLGKDFLKKKKKNLRTHVRILGKRRKERAFQTEEAVHKRVLGKKKMENKKRKKYIFFD